MKKYNRDGAHQPMESETWLANFMVPKQKPIGTFQLIFQGTQMYQFDFMPNGITKVTVPQLEDIMFRINVNPSHVVMPESSLYTEWFDIKTLLQERV